MWPATAAALEEAGERETRQHGGIAVGGGGRHVTCPRERRGGDDILHITARTSVHHSAVWLRECKKWDVM